MHNQYQTHPINWRAFGAAMIVVIALIALFGFADAASSQPLPDAFVEVDSNYVVGVGTHLAPPSWDCSFFPYVDRCRIDHQAGFGSLDPLWPSNCGGGGNPIIPSPSTRSAALYTVNGAKAVYERATQRIFYFVQFNNKAACDDYQTGNDDLNGDGTPFDAQGLCEFPDGPGGEQNGIGGDEFIIVTCPAFDPLCKISSPELITDHTRPHNDGHCRQDVDPASCDKNSWQIKAVTLIGSPVGEDTFLDVQKVQGFGGKVAHYDSSGNLITCDGTTFPCGEEIISKPTHIVFRHTSVLSITNPSTNWNADGGGTPDNIRTAFSVTPDRRWCGGTFTTAWSDDTFGYCAAAERGTTCDDCETFTGANLCGNPFPDEAVWLPWESIDCPEEATKTRVIDAPLERWTRGEITLPLNTNISVTVTPEYFGLLSWSQDITGTYVDGAFCLEGGPGVSCKGGLLDGRSYFLVDEGIATYFADYDLDGNIAQWFKVAWGREVPASFLKIVPSLQPTANELLLGDVATLRRRTSDLSVVNYNGNKRFIIAQSVRTEDPSIEGLGNSPCGASANDDNRVFACNFPDAATETKGYSYRWMWWDPILGAVVDENGNPSSDAKANLNVFGFANNGPMPSIYAEGTVGWAYDYFEIPRVDRIDRFFCYGTKDTTACRVPESLTFDNATGRDLRCVQVEFPAEPDIIFRSDFEFKNTSEWTDEQDQ